MLETILSSKKSSEGSCSKYLCDLVQKHISSFSSYPLWPADRPDLLVPWTRIALAQHRAFASMGLSMWNDPSSNSFLLSATLRAPLNS